MADSSSYTTDDREVTVRLSEIRHIRDALGKLPERHTHNLLRHLWRQVAALHDRLNSQQPLPKKVPS